MPNKPTYEKLKQRVKELEQSEKALKDSERLFSQMFEQSTVSTQLLDPEGNSIQVNQKFCELFGVIPEDMKHYNILEDDAIKQTDAYEMLLDVFNNKNTHRWQNSFDIALASESSGVKTTKPEVIYVENLSFPILDNDGNIQYVVIQHPDVTDQVKANQTLEESEDKLQLLFDHSPVGICTVDLLGNFVTTNPAYEQMLGYSKEKLRELSFFDVTHPGYRPKNKALFQNMFSMESTGFKMEKKYIRNDGDEIDVSVHATAILDDKGKTRFGTAFVEDITERKQTEEQIKANLKEKETLLEEIHHRVKNNMQLIISILQLQKDYQDQTGSVNLEDTINRVRIFGDIHRKLYLQEDFTKIDFTKQIKDTLRELITAYNIKEENISLELDLPDYLLELDKAISCGLLMNELVTNSLKHAFTDKGVIRISIKRNPSGEIERIVYEDNGKGFRNSEQGFGSKIIMALAEQLNLTFNLNSENGTRYDFVKMVCDQIIEPSNKEILYVEDEIIIAMDRIANLKRAGYFVNDRVITTGEKAITYVRESSQKPSLILMDIKLDGKINGLEASLEIRKENPSIPIIFISGYEDPRHTERIAAISNSSFLNKTCASKELQNAIDSYLN